MGQGDEEVGDTDTQPDVPEAVIRERVRERRLLGLALLVISALFSGTVVGVLTATYLSRDNVTPPDSPRIQRLQAQLRQDTTSEEVREAIRLEDQELQQTYWTYRARIKWGSYLLLGGVIALLLSAKWYVSLDPKRLVPRSLRERTDAERWLGMRKHKLAALAGIGGILAVVMVVMIAVGGGNFPHEDREEPEPPATVADSGTATPVTSVEDVGFKENWPHFRGPTGMGIVEAGDWPQTWDVGTGENVVWKTPVPVPGHSSPVIWGNRIFLTGGTQEKREVLCFERKTGKLLWQTEVKSPAGVDTEVEMLDETGYAAPTPATDGERVYVVFATADMAALDFRGKVVWVQNLGAPENVYGMASSPIVYEDKLIYQFDRGGDPAEGLSAVFALSPATGEEIWRTDRPVRSSWSTPMVAETKSGPELITSAEPWVISYDPGLGTELWRAKGIEGDVAPSPVFADGIAYVTNEYSQVMAIRTGGFGDVTESNIVWTADEGMSDISSPICDGQLFLQIYSSGYMTCYDAKEGKLLWEHELDDASVWASPALVGNLVYLPDDKGQTYIFELSPDGYKPVSTADLGEPVWASPAFADAQIYIRGEKHLFCIGKQKP